MAKSDAPLRLAGAYFAKDAVHARVSQGRESTLLSRSPACADAPRVKVFGGENAILKQGSIARGLI